MDLTFLIVAGLGLLVAVVAVLVLGSHGLKRRNEGQLHRPEQDAPGFPGKTAGPPSQTFYDPRAQSLGYDPTAQPSYSYGSFRGDQSMGFESGCAPQDQPSLQPQTPKMTAKDIEKQLEQYRSLLDRMRGGDGGRSIIVEEDVRKVIEDHNEVVLGKIQNTLDALRAAIMVSDPTREGMMDLVNKDIGYVYVISNPGSFGNGIVKIGATKRVIPEVRIKELSGASVPFTFDVNCIIFSNDAFALESRLHSRFSKSKVNHANRHKEFFRCSPRDVLLEALKLDDTAIVVYDESPVNEELAATVRQDGRRIITIDPDETVVKISELEALKRKATGAVMGSGDRDKEVGSSGTAMQTQGREPLQSAQVETSKRHGRLDGDNPFQRPRSMTPAPEPIPASSPLDTLPSDHGVMAPAPTPFPSPSGSQSTVMNPFLARRR